MAEGRGYNQLEDLFRKNFIVVVVGGGGGGFSK